MTKASPFYAMSQHTKNGSGGNYPQWMRTLEQKYQKLHKKIANNNGVRFQNSLGNSVHETRLSYALIRYRDMSLQKTRCSQKLTTKDGAVNSNKVTDGAGAQAESVIKTNENNSTENKGAEQTECVIGKNENVDTENKDADSEQIECAIENNENKNIKNKSDEGVQTKDVVKNNKNNIKENKGIEGAQTEDAIKHDESKYIEHGCETSLKDNKKLNNNVEKEPVASSSYDHFEQSSLSSCKGKTFNSDSETQSKCCNVQDAEKRITAGLQPTDELDLNVIACDTVETNVVTNVEEIENYKPNRSDLKTSVSRTSKITSKSCPAKIQSRTKIQSRKMELNRDKNMAPLISRSKSANKSVGTKFTPMSAEAKHAITETILEMNLSINGPNAKAGIQFIPSRGRRCVKSWTKKSKSSHDLENVSKCLANLADKEHSNDICSNDEKGPCLSASSLPEDTHKLNSVLPEIPIACTHDRSASRSHSYRIPGIGKYEIEKDHPIFEITPPGFDSRYSDAKLVEERDSETPPPDIRQQAIDKCSEWLTKCKK